MSVFALVDCNNFYVSCERVFAPHLEKVPVAVLSNNDGCLVARSNEVKNAGIPMGAPYFKYKDKLDTLGCKVFSSNYSLYGDMSARVMSVLNQFCQEMEVYSIDEAFLDLSNIAPKDLIDFCQKLKTYVKKCTGIPVSFGLGSTKTLAKLANNLAKQDMRKGPRLYNDVFSFVDLNQDACNQIFESVEVGELWGIGRRYTKKLVANHIENVAQLIRQNPTWIKENLTIQGSRLVQELQGNPCHKLEIIPSAKKSIASTRSFGKPVTTIQSLKESLAMYATTIGQKLRKGKQTTSFLQVFVMTNRFKPGFSFRSINVALQNPTNYTPLLIQAATSQIEKLFEPGTEYKKAGIVATDLQSSESIPIPLFDYSSTTEKREHNLMQVFDSVNKKFGKHTLRSAQLGYNKDWHMKQDLTSSKYTTSWKELLKI
jgi:DNA polymerase V